MTSGAYAPAEDFRGNKRFLVLRRLGAGGAGVVYEAFDRDQGARVALKTLRRLHADAILRFKNEFRALQDIQHKNLVSLGELFEEQGLWFFTMEYIDGEDLVSYVTRGASKRNLDPFSERTIADTNTIVDLPPAPTTSESRRFSPDAPPRAMFDERRVRSVMKQLARGVRALHQAGKVHRDVKASNVLVTAEGRVVLLDFGLIMETSRANEEAETNLIVGTEKYMAPEQAAAMPVGPPADCYALGVVLYRALTGTFPFANATDDLLVLKQREKPLSPMQLLPEVPADLDALCMDLLKVSPRLRPTCEQILERLNASRTDESIAPPPMATDGPFVGRDVELAILRDAFDETLRGSCVAIAITGDSGVGKSTLVRKFGEFVSEECGAVVLGARCYEREAVPYKAVDGIVDVLARVLARFAAMDMAAILPKRASLLALAFPVLKRVTAFADAVKNAADDPVDPKEQRAQLFGALRELLARLSERLPIVIALDDLQWSDEDSLAMLRELVRPPDAPGLLLLATVRPAAGGTSPERIVEALGHARTMKIGRLGPDEAKALASLLLESVPWGGEALAESIAREAAGHPMFIDELVRHALQSGEERAKTARLEDALTERVKRLDAGQRQLMELIAVAGAPLSHEIAAHATAQELSVHARATSRLRAANLVRTSGLRRADAIEPYHDRVRDAVLAELSEDVRRTWHRRIAMAYEALDARNADALVAHWRGAHERGRAARYALMAAAHASDQLAFDRAARMYELALEIETPSAEEARAIRTNLGMALANAGRGKESARAFLDAAEIAGAPKEDEIDLKRRAAEQLLLSGHLDEGLAVLHDVLEAMGMDVPRSPNSALASFLVRRGQLRLRGLEFKERAEADVPAEDLRRIDMLAAISGSLGMVDTLRGADFQTRHVLLALKSGEARRIVRALSLEAAYSAAAGIRQAQRTARIVARARELADRLDEPLPHAWAIGGGAASAFLEGRWREAFELFSKSAVILREKCSGVAWQLDSSHFYQLGALMHLGEMNELARRIPALLQEAERRGDRYAMTHLRTGVLSIAWLARGDAGGARREADDAIARWSHQGTHLPHFLDVLAQAQIDLYEGHARAAYARVCDRWGALAKAMLLRVQFIRIKMLELRARGALALLSSPQRGDAHVREIERCVDDIEKEGTRYGAALALMLRGGLARVRGDVGVAVKLFASAEEQFQNEQMALHVAAARWRRGELVGGNEGVALMASARAWMHGQQIVDPERMLATLAPFAVR